LHEVVTDDPLLTQCTCWHKQPGPHAAVGKVAFVDAVASCKDAYFGTAVPSSIATDVSNPQARGASQPFQPKVGTVYGCAFIIFDLDGNFYGRADLILAFKIKLGLVHPAVELPSETEAVKPGGRPGESHDNYYLDGEIIEYVIMDLDAAKEKAKRSEHIGGLFWSHPDARPRKPVIAWLVHRLGPKRRLAPQLYYEPGWKACVC